MSKINIKPSLRTGFPPTFSDEESLEAYLNLINALLSFPSSESMTILNTSPELIDAGLVEAMLNVAGDLTLLGNLDAAKFLMDVAGQLMGVYGKPPIQISSSPNPQTLLIQALLATAENDPERRQEKVYSLLKENHHQLDDNFAGLLQGWATPILSEAPPDMAVGIATKIGIFSNLLANFALGNRANNLEITIAGYEVIATVFTRETSPERWAHLQNNLGVAYQERIRGNRAKNLALALARYQYALNVLTREGFREQWAGIKINLGMAYLDRFRDAYLNQMDGDMTENLKLAIAAFEDALSVFTHKEFPEEWAKVKTNLGNAYLYGKQLSQAIACYRSALKVYQPTALQFAQF